MVKEYGKISDAEKDFFKTVNSEFKIVEIESIEEYTEFSKNPKSKEKEIISEFEKKIENFKDNQKNKNIELRRKELELKQVWSDIFSTAKKVKKYYGNLKEEEQEKLDKLNLRKDNLKESIRELKERLMLLEVEIKESFNEKKYAEKKMIEDLKIIEKQCKNKIIMSKLKGAQGERKVIDTIKNKFSKEKGFHLVNAFDINLMGEAIRIDGKIRTENKIDHILICPKGIFVIETKYWKMVNDGWIKNVEKQVRAAKEVFSKIFDKEINQGLNFVILSVGKEIISNDENINSINLEDFEDFILSKTNCLTKDDLIVIMNKFLPYLGDSQISSFGKGALKFKNNIVKGKRFFGKLFKK